MWGSFVKHIFVLALAVMASASAAAANVTMNTPALGDDLSYILNGQYQGVFNNIVNDEEFGTLDYLDRRTELGLVNALVNDGEELIYLSAFRNSAFDSSNGSNNKVVVALQNDNPAPTEDSERPMTDGVSLVLSGGESLLWNITIDRNVTLNSIFIFSPNNQTVVLSSNEVDFDNVNINIKVSPTSVCGYSLPIDGNGCNTDRILGINSQSYDIFGFEDNTNGQGLNYLEHLTTLDVTNFNGSYIVDEFVVKINSIATVSPPPNGPVVPLPGSFLLYASAIAVLSLQRRKK